MNEKMYAVYYDEISRDIKQYKGKEISFNEFVYKEDAFAENQLVIGRYLITHCVAEASIVGFLSEIEKAGTVPENTSIKVL